MSANADTSKGMDWDKLLRKEIPPVRLPPLKLLTLDDEQKPEFESPRDVINSFDHLDKLLQFEL